MLSHRQNSRALSGQRCPGSKAQSHERVKFIKIIPVKLHGMVTIPEETQLSESINVRHPKRRRKNSIQNRILAHN
jgi:hypothetical protein